MPNNLSGIGGAVPVRIVNNGTGTPVSITGSIPWPTGEPGVFTTVTATAGVQTQPETTNGYFLILPESATGSTNFAFTYNQNNYPSGGEGDEAYRNNVVAWGHNIGTTTGTAAIEGEPATYFAIESKYFQGTYGAEVHLQILDTEAVLHRPMTFFLNHDGTGGAGSFTLDEINIANWSGVQKVKIDCDNNVIDVGTLATGVAIRFANNNLPNTQSNAAGDTYLSLPYINSDNRTVLGAASLAVGTTPTTGTYPNVFWVIQPTSLATGGTVLSIVAPAVTGTHIGLDFAATATADFTQNFTNSGTGNATLKLAVADGAGGDPKIIFTNQAVTQWQIGQDNSDGDQFKIGFGSLGNDTRMTFEPSATGGVSIGPANPNSTAILDVQSTTKSFLPPRMTKAQRDAISSPAEGSVVHQTDNTPGPRWYVGGAWQAVTLTADP